MTVRYLHTMVRVMDLDASKAFYEKLGFERTSYRFAKPLAP